MNRIGIFGGSFDPPHYGHLLLAQEALRVLKLTQVIFVPTYCHPLKKKAWADDKKRLKMVELATGDNNIFTSSDFEIKKKGLSYTYDTLKYFKNIYGNQTQLFFLAGSDCLGELSKWKHADKLMSLAKFVVAERPNARKRRIPKNIRTINMPLVDISSSIIRKNIKHRYPVAYMMPEKVLKYIRRYRLYRG